MDEPQEATRSILVERHGPVALVILNRPDALNALTVAMRRAFVATLDALALDQEIRAVVLTGAGERAFSTGLDLNELKSGTVRLGVRDTEIELGNPVLAVERIGKPVIAAVHGYAITGALELALACDIIVCAPNAQFGDTHARMGLLPAWGGSQRLTRAVGAARAHEMILTTKFIDAETALAWGLVNHIVPTADLRARALAIADAIAAREPQYVSALNALIADGTHLPLKAGLELERERSTPWNRAVVARRPMCEVRTHD